MQRVWGGRKGLPCMCKAKSAKLFRGEGGREPPCLVNPWTHNKCAKVCGANMFQAHGTGQAQASRLPGPGRHGMLQAACIACHGERRRGREMREEASALEGRSLAQWNVMPVLPCFVCLFVFLFLFLSECLNTHRREERTPPLTPTHKQQHKNTQKLIRRGREGRRWKKLTFSFSSPAFFLLHVLLSCLSFFLSARAACNRVRGGEEVNLSCPVS